MPSVKAEMTLFEQDLAADEHLRRAHTDFAAAAAHPEHVSPVRIVVGVLRAGLAIAAVTMRAQHLADPIALRPRVLRA